MKIFVTHNPEDREMYFHWAMEPLRARAVKVSGTEIVAG